MKETGWDRFVEWAIFNNITPSDLLDDNKHSQVMSHLATLRVLANIEKDVFSSQISDIKTGVVMKNFTDLVNKGELK